MKTKVFALCMLLVTLLCAVSCNLFNQDDEEKEEYIENTRYYTVEFYELLQSSLGGTKLLSSQTVQSGKTVSKPANPSDKWGRKFLGWYESRYYNPSDYDDLYDSEFSFTSSICSNEKLYAKFEGDLVPVYFDLNDGTTPNDYTTDGYDVSYASYGDYIIYSAEGGIVKAPTNPVRTGYKFVGWVYSWWSHYNEGKLYDFNTKVEKSADNGKRLVLEAKWVTDDTKTYTVTFNTNGGSSVQSQIISQGGSVSTPLDPSKDGYNFVGWYSDSSLTDEFDFSSQIIGDITLYAKWFSTESSCTISYETNCDKKISSQVVLKGEKIEAKSFEANTKYGYSFSSWYTDSNFNSRFDFDTSVNSDITLYAKWVVTTPAIRILDYQNTSDWTSSESVYINGERITLSSSNSLKAIKSTPYADSYEIYYSRTSNMSSATKAYVIEQGYYSSSSDSVIIYIPNLTTGTYYFWIKSVKDGIESSWGGTEIYTKE